MAAKICWAAGKKTVSPVSNASFGSINDLHAFACKLHACMLLHVHINQFTQMHMVIKTVIKQYMS